MQGEFQGQRIFMLAVKKYTSGVLRAMREAYGPDTDGMSPGGFKMFVFAFDCIDR